MKNLNKENFWNSMQERFPYAMRLFCTWIDEYKKDVDWNWFFGNGWTVDKNDPPVTATIRQIKFHDIPFEMQVGILALFFSANFGFIYSDITSYSKVREATETFLKTIERKQK
jgi:hypothetical protein